MYYSKIRIITFKKVTVIVTLTLGLQSRQRFAKARAKREAWDSHFMLSGLQENVRE
jgi:hypothetical protein